MYASVGITELAAADNNNAVIVAIITVAGVFATVVGTYLAGRYASKKSADAAKDTIKVTEKQVDFGALDGIVKNLQAEAGRLAKRVQELEDRDVEKNGRIEALELLVHQSDSKYRVALTYVRDILNWATALVVAPEHTVPKAPSEIAEDLNQ
jgi:uncharacterized protein with FMN-binding domain